MGVPAIDLRDVTVMKAGKRLVSGIDWRVGIGERWVLFGPNGAGKTTLLQVISTYQFPTGGTATILGERMGRTDVRRLRPGSDTWDPPRPRWCGVTCRAGTWS